MTGRLLGWRLVGTAKFWPMVLGDPPRFLGRWEEIRAR